MHDKPAVFWLCYNLVFVPCFLLVLPHFFLRMIRRGGYASDFGHRLGFYTRVLKGRLATGPRIWIHAVSVGEYGVAEGIIQRWRMRDPSARFVVSVTTSTAHQRAVKRMDERDVLIYFPVDFPIVMRRVLTLIRPRAILLIETELWPNLVRIARSRQIPVYLVNGRLSERSARRYARIRPVMCRILPELSHVFMQSDVDAERMIDLGLPRESSKVIGTAKYDIAPDNVPGMRESLRPDSLLLVGGSTWNGEEAALLDAYIDLRKTYPRLSLVLVPRHAERSAEVVEAVRARGLTLVRRSQGIPQGDADILLVDQTGELLRFYASADVVFVGKSLCAKGGQNPIEPAALGKAIIVGPHMENFASVMKDLQSDGAIVQIQDVTELRGAINRLLEDRDERLRLGGLAARVVERMRGSIDRTLDLIPEAR